MGADLVPQTFPSNVVIVSVTVFWHIEVTMNNFSGNNHFMEKQT